MVSLNLCFTAGQDFVPVLLLSGRQMLASKVKCITTAHHDPEFSVLSGFNWDVEAIGLF